jgi:DNA polymerase-3 subunit delta
VKQYREQLEDYVARPRESAVLVLEVTTWPSNTRLAKAVADSGLTIKCQTPTQGRELTEFTRQLKDWLISAARREFDAELARPAVDQLIELLPTEPGILYQEVARLALLAGTSKKIDAALVQDNVGGWRTRKTWDMIDAAAGGRASEAIEQLDRLLAAGEEAFGLLPQMASTFRKFALAVRLYDQAEQRRQPLSLRQALERAGMPPFKLGDAERQLRQIGRPRARQLYRWLLAADLEIKGYNSSKERARRVLETLIVRLSRQAQGVEQ